MLEGQCMNPLRPLLLLTLTLTLSHQGRGENNCASYPVEGEGKTTVRPIPSGERGKGHPITSRERGKMKKHPRVAAGVLALLFSPPFLDPLPSKGEGRMEVNAVLYGDTLVPSGKYTQMPSPIFTASSLLRIR